VFLLIINSVFATEYYVAQDGSGDFSSIQQAVNGVSGGDTIIVRDGTYTGRTTIRESFNEWITIKAENQYQAKLTNAQNGADVFDIYTTGPARIIVEGFIMTNEHPTYQCGSRESNYVVHFQDAEDIIFQNNIVYGNNAPGTCNEIIKVNRGSEIYYPRNIHIRGNVLYDPASAGGSDIIDSVRPGELDIYENIFFSRNSPDSQSFITLKREVQAGDIPAQYRPARVPRHRVHKNIFLNWDGKNDQAFVQFGEDGYDEYMITNSLIENNLFIGNSANPIVAAIQLKGAESITVRANTAIGDMQGSSFGFRIGTETNNPDVDGYYIYNNIWSDPTGTMNRFGRVYEVSGTVSGIDLDNNLFWNNNNPLPTSGDILPTSDANRVVADPLINIDQNNIVLPVWNDNSFASGTLTIREEFERLVDLYGALGVGSAAIDSASGNMPSDDILGNPRDANPDIGCFEVQGGIAGCGDGNCDDSEDCTTCPADCGACGPVCGDGTCDATESCITCATDCGECPIDCVHSADLPVCDGCIDTSELSAYIDLWKSGSVEMTELMEVIGLWKNGC